MKEYVRKKISFLAIRPWDKKSNKTIWSSHLTNKEAMKIDKLDKIDKIERIN